MATNEGSGCSLRALLSEELYRDYVGDKATSEFREFNDEDLQKVISNTENRNTKRTTQTWLNRFDSWRKSRGISQELHEIPTEELDKILQHFFAELVKGDGTDPVTESNDSMPRQKPQRTWSIS